MNEHIDKSHGNSDDIIAKAILLGTVEGALFWPLLWFWFYINAWSEEPTSPRLPLVLGSVVALQLLLGGIGWRINYQHGRDVYWGKLFAVSGLAIFAVPFEFALFLLLKDIF